MSSGSEPDDPAQPGSTYPRATSGRGWLTILAVLAVVGHLVALYIPGSAVPSVGIPYLDKLVHMLLFGIPVWLLGRLTGRVWLVVGIFGAHAVASELIQWRFIPNRSGDPLDLVADAIGIAAAVWLLRTPVTEVDLLPGDDV